MTDQETIGVYNRQVERYLKMVDGPEEDPILMCFIDRFKASDYILDLGCGPGHAAAVMRSKGLLVDPVDAAAEMVKLANEKFTISARQANFSDIDATDLYHGVWANFSLLHAHTKDLEFILLALHRALKPKGFMHLGMKLGQGSQRDRYGRYYAYYSQAELEDHVNNAGFTVKKVDLGTAAGMAGDMEPWIALTGLAR